MGRQKMATVTSGKRPYKQDLPPKGGYAPFEYKRVPIRKYMSAPRLFGAVFVWTGLGMAYWSRKERINAALKTEKRSIELALQPMLSAERDRALIKHIIQSRDAEEELMKDVPGWEVGAFFGKPVYKALTDEEKDNKYHMYAISPYESNNHSNQRHNKAQRAYHHHWQLGAAAFESPGLLKSWVASCT